jgi:hypothetical protein
LCYWWSNPNDAAVAIGMCLPFIWILSWYFEKEKLAGYVQNMIWVVECAALALLVGTCSRWAIFSSMCSIVVFGLIAEKPLAERVFRSVNHQAFLPAMRQRCIAIWLQMKSMKNTGLRIFVILVALIATNAWGRFSLAVQGDKSVTNRLTLWAGGAKMVADKPVLGWGNGSAGLNYDNWYQDLSSQTMHGSMVNSYLNIAVEWGLPALGLILFFLLAGILLCYRLAGLVSPSGRGLLAGAGAMMVFFTMVNACYSTIYNSLPLALLAAGVLIIAVFYGGRKRYIALSSPMLLSFSISLFCVLSLYLFGLASIAKDPVRISHAAAGTIWLCKPGAPQKAPDLTIVPDYKILGPCHGRRIRKLFCENMDYLHAIQVVEPGAELNNCDGGRVVVLGARVGSWGARPPKDNQGVILVCPVAPPSAPMKIQLLFLPQADRWHVAEAWRSWARQNKCPVVFIEGDGVLDEANFQKVIDYCIDS